MVNERYDPCNCNQHIFYQGFKLKGGPAITVIGNVNEDEDEDDGAPRRIWSDQTKPILYISPNPNPNPYPEPRQFSYRCNCVVPCIINHLKFDYYAIAGLSDEGGCRFTFRLNEDGRHSIEIASNIPQKCGSCGRYDQTFYQCRHITFCDQCTIYQRRYRDECVYCRMERFIDDDDGYSYYQNDADMQYGMLDAIEGREIRLCHRKLRRRYKLHPYSVGAKIGKTLLETLDPEGLEKVLTTIYRTI